MNARCSAGVRPWWGNNATNGSSAAHFFYYGCADSCDAVLPPTHKNTSFVPRTQPVTEQPMAQMSTGLLRSEPMTCPRPRLRHLVFNAKHVRQASIAAFPDDLLYTCSGQVGLASTTAGWLANSGSAGADECQAYFPSRNAGANNCQATLRLRVRWRWRMPSYRTSA